MKVTITRLDYTCETGSNGGYQVRIGRGPGKSLYVGDAKCGGKRGALAAAKEVGHALTVLGHYFPDLTVGRQRNAAADS